VLCNPTKVAVVREQLSSSVNGDRGYQRVYAARRYSVLPTFVDDASGLDMVVSIGEDELKARDALVESLELVIVSQARK
jgi:hypothetical protein